MSYVKLFTNSITIKTQFNLSFKQYFYNFLTPLLIV